ncbi:MAG: amino acid adenylation domain-containing protein [Pseudomonadota bacterium]
MTRPNLDGVDEVMPLAPTQRGMLFECLEDGATRGLYVGSIAVTLTGPLDTARLRSAFETEIQSRDSYRAAFFSASLSQPVQMVQKHIKLPWQEVDLSTLSEREFDQEVYFRMEADRLEGFDLKRAPLMRVQLLRHAPGSHVLIWTLHHLISDGWSTGTVLNAILERYHGSAEPPAPMPYKRFLAWQQKQDHAQALAYWTKALEGVESFSVIPDKLASAPKAGLKQQAHQRGSVQVSASDWQQFCNMARQARVTPQTALSTFFAVLLGRYTRETDVLFGTTNAGRPTGLKGADQAAGAYLNTLPQRMKIEAGSTLRTILTQAQDEANARRAFELTPLPEVLKTAPNLRHGSRMETIFVYEAFPESAANPAHQITAETLARADASSAQLALLAHPSDEGLTLEAITRPEDMRAALAEAFLADLSALVSQAANNLDAPLGTLLREALAPPSASPTSTSLRRQDPFVWDQIKAQMAAQPDEIALDDGVSQLTYAALDQHSRALAAALKNRGVGKGDVVAIALPRGVSVVVAMLAAWRVGAAYTPIDLTYPSTRQTQIIAAAEPKVILVADDTTAAKDGPKTLLYADALTTPSDRFTDADLTSKDLAYLIFTSGSQSAPKGVMITQGNLAYSNAVRAEVYPSAPRGFVMLSSFAFDSSVVGLFWTLSAGGTLTIASSGAEQDPGQLTKLIARAGPAHLLALPALYETLLHSDPTALSSLECVIVAGEAVQASTIKAHQSALPTTPLFNEYGPTEATVWCAASRLDGSDPSAPIAIGTAPPSTQLSIVDLNGRPLPQGVPGALWVQGPGVSPGYLNAPKLTEAAFNTQQSPPLYQTGDLGYTRADGQIVFLGREDRQIKLRGHRIELTEIETALARAAPGLETAIWVEDTQLKAAILDAEADVDSIKTQLASNLPSVMVPSQVLAVENFPRLPNGKIDTRALTGLSSDSDAAQPLHTRTKLTLMEQKLAEVWSSVLKTSNLTPDAHFFDLGGDSLKSISAVLKAEELGLALTGHEIFDHPVLSDLAAKLEKRATERYQDQPYANFAVANSNGDKPPFFMIHGSLEMYSYLSGVLGASRPLGFVFSHFLQGDIALGDRIEDLSESAYRRLKSMRPEGPYHIGGYSIGAVVALHLANRLTREGAEVKTLFLLDPSYGVWDKTKDRLKHRMIGRVGALGWSLSAALNLADPVQARHAAISHSYRRMMTFHAPQAYGGPTILMMTPTVARKAGTTGWLAEAVPQAQRMTLELDHFGLQKDKDALLTWTTALAQQLQAADRKTAGAHD